MPEIHLTNEQGELDQISPLKLLSVMMFPRDPSRRDDLLATIELWAGFGLSAAGEDSPFARILNPLERISEEKERLRAVTAGMVLVNIRSLKQNHVGEEDSLNKAIHVLLPELQDQNIPANRKYVWRAWSDFRSVAHFWAAFLILEDVDRFTDTTFGPMAKEAAADKIPISVLALRNTKTFRVYLGIAENMRRWGEAHFTTRSREPTLPPDETWKVQADIDLPDTSIRLGPLPPLAEAALDNYRAPT